MIPDLFMKLALDISNRSIDSQRENHIYRQSESRKGQAKKGKTHISLNTHDRIWLKGARGIKKTGRIQQKPWKGDMLKPGVSTQWHSLKEFFVGLHEVQIPLTPFAKGGTIKHSFYI